MNEYQVTSEEDNAAFAFAYMLKLFRSGFYFDCSGGIAFNHENPTAFKVSQVSDSTDVIETLINLLGDLNEAIGVLEIYMDSRSAQGEWEQGDYFESGLFTGKGVVNAGFTIYGIISRYSE